MICYFLAGIDITDHEKYHEYVERVGALVTAHGGRYLAVDDQPILLEGAAQRGRVVLIQFPDEASLRGWYESPAYQAILQLRRGSADCDAVLIHGKNG